MRWALFALAALPLVVACGPSPVPHAIQLACAPGSGPRLAGDDLRSSASELPRDLRCANLGGARLDGLGLSQVDLTGAVLKGASLRGIDLTQARLAGADLRDADLSDAQLTQADLTAANLTGANLTGANLDQATLTDARLDRAEVFGASMIQASVDSASTAGLRGLFPVDELAAVMAGLLVLVMLVAWRPVARPGAATVRRLGAGGLTGRIAFATLPRCAARVVGAVLCGAAVYLVASLLAWFLGGIDSPLVSSCASVTCLGGLARSPLALIPALLLLLPGVIAYLEVRNRDAPGPLTGDDAWARARAGAGLPAGGLALLLGAAAVLVAVATGSGQDVLGVLGVAVLLVALLLERRYRRARVAARGLDALTVTAEEGGVGRRHPLDAGYTLTFRRPVAIAQVRAEVRYQEHNGVDDYGRDKYVSHVAVLQETGPFTGEPGAPLVRKLWWRPPESPLVMAEASLRVRVAPRGGQPLVADHPLAVARPDS